MIIIRYKLLSTGDHGIDAQPMTVYCLWEVAYTWATKSTANLSPNAGIRHAPSSNVANRV